MQILVKAKANVNLQTLDKKMAPLHLAACKGQTEVAKELIAAPGVTLDVENFVGDTPLHEAVRYGQKEVVQLLIDKGADKDFPNSSAGDDDVQSVDK